MPTEHLELFVIDDDDMIVTQLDAFLKQKGVVQGAGTGKDALNKLANLNPDMIFVDIGLPDMTGFELIGHIRRMAHLSKTAIIIITADTAVENHVTTLELGADEFLTKPIDGALTIELVNKIRRNRQRLLSGEDTSRYENSFAISLMENLVTPTFVINADGFVVIWNKACEDLTGLKAIDVIGTKNHWSGFYDTDRICLVDLLLPKSRSNELVIDVLYNEIIKSGENHSLHAENWCVMPLKGEKKYLAIDAGPIYDDSGKLIAAVETLTDLTELKETQSKFEKLSTIDALTGLGNRGFFDVQLDALWFSTRRHRQAFSLLMIDVDYFKNFNDHYGHPRGDECLKAVAQVISESISRSLDLAFRYGGEEFTILLPDTDAEGASAVAERINDGLKQLAMEHINRPTPKKIVTVSIGISTCFPRENLDSKTLLLRADEALYRAKLEGRDRYVVSEAIS